MKRPKWLGGHACRSWPHHRLGGACILARQGRCQEGPQFLRLLPFNILFPAALIVAYMTQETTLRLIPRSRRERPCVGSGHGCDLGPASAARASPHAPGRIEWRGRRSRLPRRGRGRGRRHARSACRAAPPATQRRRRPPSPRRAHAPGRPRPRARREAEASPTRGRARQHRRRSARALRREVDPAELVVDPDVPDKVRELERDPEPPERLGLSSRTEDGRHYAADDAALPSM